MASERWVGVIDVAAHLGVAKDSVYRWIDERGLPAHRVGRLFRFKLSEIDEWVRQDNGQAMPTRRLSSRVFPTNSIRISAGRARSPQKTRSSKRWSRRASPRTASSGSAI
ncbi:MAG: hypothetical protein COX20_04170 [Desulfobacterales bacterium CG23_combo_of_CG06-09_8_20_14_all_52_9]|nr:MAG: hypothetical protein COX20_04170 [Desulfobacterales bacterium CG23_combo_of_CG06-09_8_20_14_all_52_9]